MEDEDWDKERQVEEHQVDQEYPLQTLARRFPLVVNDLLNCLFLEHAVFSYQVVHHHCQLEVVKDKLFDFALIKECHFLAEDKVPEVDESVVHIHEVFVFSLFLRHFNFLFCLFFWLLFSCLFIPVIIFLFWFFFLWLLCFLFSFFFLLYFIIKKE